MDDRLQQGLGAPGCSHDLLQFFGRAAENRSVHEVCAMTG